MATNAMALAIVDKSSVTTLRVWAGARTKNITEMIASLISLCANHVIWQNANAWANLWHLVFGWLASFNKRVLKQATGVSRINISDIIGSFIGSMNSTMMSYPFPPSCMPSCTTMYKSEIKAMVLTHINTAALALYKVLICLFCCWSQRNTLRKWSRVDASTSRFEKKKIPSTSAQALRGCIRTLTFSAWPWQ